MRPDTGADLCDGEVSISVWSTQGAALELMFIQKNNEYLTLITSTSLPSFQQQTSHRQASKFSLVLHIQPSSRSFFSNVTDKLSAEY